MVDDELESSSSADRVKSSFAPWGRLDGLDAPRAARLATRERPCGEDEADTPTRRGSHPVISNLSRLVSGVACRVAALGHVTRRELDRRLTELEERLMANESDLHVRLATRIGMMLAEAASLRESVVTKDAALAAAQGALASEVAGRDVEIARQLAEALELDAQLDAARLEELLRQSGEDVPAPVPDVPTPAPGEPAEVPPGSDVPPVDESTLPPTDVPATPGGV